MGAKKDTVDEHLRFAYEASLDNNAYTSEKTICDIIAGGTESISEDKAAFAYSIFPELRQQ
jgi:hypothetical protein